MTRTKHHGDKAKQRKFGEGWRWMTTPSWWTRMTMTRPQRRAASTWQKNTEKTAIDAIENVDTPLSKRKPHHYFW